MAQSFHNLSRLHILYIAIPHQQNLLRSGPTSLQSAVSQSHQMLHLHDVVWVDGGDVLLVLETAWSRTPQRHKLTKRTGLSLGTILTCLVARSSIIVISSSSVASAGTRDMAAIWIYPEGIVVELAEVTKSQVLKLLGSKLECITLHMCSSEPNSFRLSFFMRHVFYCLLAFVQLHLNRWVLTHPNVRGLEFPFNHMFGKQDRSVPEGRAGSLCSHVYVYKYIHMYILYISICVLPFYLLIYIYIHI